jgi:hypothetical protein
VQRFFYSNAHVVLYHQFSELLAINEDDSSGYLLSKTARLKREI